MKGKTLILTYSDDEHCPYCGQYKPHKWEFKDVFWCYGCEETYMRVIVGTTIFVFRMEKLDD